MTALDIESLAKQLVAGDRRALARAITLVESTKADHGEQAERLLQALLPHAGKSYRIGISGVPGVGKSSLIETFGQHLIQQGHRVAVLAVDPSSRRSGGSILGDKTRMQELAKLDSAFIRPSPAGGTLGGVARRTREAITVCEAADFDVVLVETVGVGQSETAVSEMTDVFLLLLQPAAGDDLQGIKRGIVELADVILVTKADGDLAAAANRTAADYTAALQLLRPTVAGWDVPVKTCSAVTGDGVEEAWTLLQTFRGHLDSLGILESRRAAQAREWMWTEVGAALRQALSADPVVHDLVAPVEASVTAGELTPSAAARRLVSAFLAPRSRLDRREQG